MIKPFHFFKGHVYSDEYTLPVRTDPPFGISNRHWNMLPQDLRGGEREDIETYIEGWEAARHANYNNPYPDQLRGEMWNRGWHSWWERRNRVNQNYNNINFNPPLDERYPEYYNTDDHVFFDVSEERYGTIHGSPYKVMLFRSIEEGNTVEGQTIYPPHPMYNFPDVI